MNAWLCESPEDARLHAEAEHLRSALLASISHDLRNPLASMVGSAGGLERQWSKLPDDARLVLLRPIRSEAERLDGFIANLLDITRIEAGVVRPRRDAIYLSDALGAALSQATRVLSDRRLVINIIDAGDLRLNLIRRTATIRGTEVRLSPREFTLLQLLAGHAGKVLTHSFILRHVWGIGTDVQ